VKTITLITALASCAIAQTQGEPFFLIRVVHSAPRPYPDDGAIQPYRAAKPGVDVLGMAAIIGTSQTWLIESHRSFSSIEAVDKALSQIPSGAAEEEILAPSTRWIGLYRLGLSYRPDEALKLLPTARYFQVSIFRIRPGADLDFAELVQLRKASFDSINLDRPEIGYQIISGASSGVYVFLAPLPSLRTWDNGFARMPVYAEGLGFAGKKAGRQITAEADVTREHLLFRVEPRNSHVSKVFAEADPEFWHGGPGRK
jgi:hypothetical protein